MGVEGKRGRGRACPAAEGRRAWIRKGGLPFLTADVQRTAAMDRALRGSTRRARTRPGGRSGWWAFDAPPPLRVPRFARRGGPEPAGYGTTLRGVSSGLHPARGNPLRVPATFPVRTGNWGGHCPARPGCCVALVISPLRPTQLYLRS